MSWIEDHNESHSQAPLPTDCLLGSPMILILDDGTYNKELRKKAHIARKKREGKKQFY